MQCEKISWASTHFPVSSFCPASIGLTADGVRTFPRAFGLSGKRKSSRSVTVNYNRSPFADQQGPSVQTVSHHYGPPRSSIQAPSRDASPPNSALIWGVFSLAAVLCSLAFGGSTLGSGRTPSSEPSLRTARQIRIKLYPFKLYVSVNS
ncbi:hypothetical protein PO909_013517 [Leuciscus waleckii]